MFFYFLFNYYSLMIFLRQIGQRPHTRIRGIRTSNWATPTNPRRPGLAQWTESAWARLSPTYGRTCMPEHLDPNRPEGWPKVWVSLECFPQGSNLRPMDTIHWPQGFTTRLELLWYLFILLLWRCDSFHYIWINIWRAIYIKAKVILRGLKNIE